MYRIIRVCVVVSSLLLILSIAALADPVITKDWAFIDNRPADDPFVSGLTLNLTVRATDILGSDALKFGSASVFSNNAGFPFLPNPHNVPLNAVFPIINGAEYTALLPIGVHPFSSVTGTYTFTVTNTSSQSASETSHNLDKPEVIAIPTNLAFSNNSTTPIFTFVDLNPTPGPAGLNRRYQVDIFDASITNIFESPTLLTTSFTVPSGILEAGKTYYFRADIFDYDSEEWIGHETVQARVENRAIEWTTAFVPVPEPGILILLGISMASIVGLRRWWKD